MDEEESDEGSRGSSDVRQWAQNVRKETQPKPRKTITVEVFDSEDEDGDSDNDERLKVAEACTWKLILKKKGELESLKHAHDKIQRAIAKANGDVGKPTHARHPELWYKFCGYDGCQTHADQKIRDAYFAAPQEPIYWVTIVRDPETDNVERVQGPHHKEVIACQRRQWALNA